MAKEFSPKDFFLQLAAFVALYVSVVSVLVLLFQYINILYPDELFYSGYPYRHDEPIRFAMATLIIVFPLYILFARLVNKNIRQHPEKRESTFRRWMIHITLFIAGATIAGDLIALVNTFLGGEITIRFLLKVAAILAVVGIGFFYYFLDLKNVWHSKEKESVLLGGIVSGLTFLVVASGFFIAGTPSELRALRFDEERVRDLETIQNHITRYWQLKETLPRTLDELDDPLLSIEVPEDPQTKQEYGYAVLGITTFELCAVFDQSTPEHSTARPVAFAPEAHHKESWHHEAGRFCFTRMIDPERFPKIDSHVR